MCKRERPLTRIETTYYPTERSPTTKATCPTVATPTAYAYFWPSVSCSNLRSMTSSINSTVYSNDCSGIASTCLIHLLIFWAQLTCWVLALRTSSLRVPLGFGSFFYHSVWSYVTLVGIGNVRLIYDWQRCQKSGSVWCDACPNWIRNGEVIFFVVVLDDHARLCFPGIDFIY